MVVWSHQLDITMMVLLWLVNLTCSGPNCPKDLLNEVFSCLRNLTHGSNQTTLLSAIDVELMRRNCSGGAFRDSVRCLQRLHNQCDKPEAKEWLAKLARPSRWEAGFDRFCRHIDLYIEKKQCIHEQNIHVEACVKNHNNIFTNNNQFVSYKPSGYSVDATKMRSVCSVFHWTDHCLSKPLGLSCGEPVGAIVKDFQGGITPPICVNYDVTSSSSTISKRKKTFGILFTVLCSVLYNVL